MIAWFDADPARQTVGADVDAAMGRLIAPFLSPASGARGPTLHPLARG